MKKPINDVKRMQQLAGILKEGLAVNDQGELEDDRFNQKFIPPTGVKNDYEKLVAEELAGFCSKNNIKFPISNINDLNKVNWYINLGSQYDKGIAGTDPNLTKDTDPDFIPIEQCAAGNAMDIMEQSFCERMILCMKEGLFKSPEAFVGIWFAGLEHHGMDTMD
jgi:hypothetical protein